LNLHITSSRNPPYLLPLQFQQPSTHPPTTTTNEKLSNPTILETIYNLLASSTSKYLILALSTILLILVINDATGQVKTFHAVQAWDQKQQERTPCIDLLKSQRRDYQAAKKAPREAELRHVNIKSRMRGGQQGGSKTSNRESNTVESKAQDKFHACQDCGQTPGTVIEENCGMVLDEW
jgi:hypothetical protein